MATTGCEAVTSARSAAAAASVSHPAAKVSQLVEGTYAAAMGICLQQQHIPLQQRPNTESAYSLSSIGAAAFTQTTAAATVATAAASAFAQAYLLLFAYP